MSPANESKLVGQARLVQWLYPRTKVFTWSVPGLWYDIGSKETLEEANRIYAKG